MNEIAEQLKERTTRVAVRARSHRDFVAKIGIVVEEADETVFWLRLLQRADINNTVEGTDLLNEAQERLAIFIQSAKTASANQ